MSVGANGYQPITDILAEIRRAQDANALLAALSMVYVGIDTFAWLSTNKPYADKPSFIDWVDGHLKADESQPYQYSGIDVYAARCAFMHNCGSISSLHEKENPPKVFGYLDNGPHQIDPGRSLVLISIAVLIHDFHKAALAYMGNISKNSALKENVDSKILSLVSMYDVRTT